MLFPPVCATLILFESYKSTALLNDTQNPLFPKILESNCICLRVVSWLFWQAVLPQHTETVKLFLICLGQFIV